MGDPLAGNPITIDDFIPIVGKNYIAPHLVSIPTGTAYTKFRYSRPVLLIPQTPTTTGTVYIYPDAYPVGDASSMAIPSGNNIYLDARGTWWVRTASSGTETFLVIDIGAAGNAAAISAALGGGSSTTTAPANRGAWASAQKTVAVPSTAEQCASQAIPRGFSVNVMALPTNTGNAGIGPSAAAADLVTGTPTILIPGASIRLYVTNTNLIWVDTIVAGNGISLTVEV